LSGLFWAVLIENNGGIQNNLGRDPGPSGNEDTGIEEAVSQRGITKYFRVKTE
jgi:hypothetical protein